MIPMETARKMVPAITPTRLIPMILKKSDCLAVDILIPPPDQSDIRTTRLSLARFNQQKFAN
ncbi:MAG: hypothetical protein A2749_02575 [Parcubacteria group bacterium RIFCSPHIGHO2_01_FULL_45_26]|nr:MAG: hypothetical protein A2749_02575 [Parcubacteria group bacterium RIFCSPHIGHO2_01_FULL_45_26]